MHTLNPLNFVNRKNKEPFKSDWNGFYVVADSLLFTLLCITACLGMSMYRPVEIRF